MYVLYIMVIHYKSKVLIFSSYLPPDQNSITPGVPHLKTTGTEYKPGKLVKSFIFVLPSELL